MKLLEHVAHRLDMCFASANEVTTQVCIHVVIERHGLRVVPKAEYYIKNLPPLSADARAGAAQ